LVFGWLILNKLNKKCIALVSLIPIRVSFSRVEISKENFSLLSCYLCHGFQLLLYHSGSPIKNFVFMSEICLTLMNQNRDDVMMMTDASYSGRNGRNSVAARSTLVVRRARSA
jgi:hypothetical protein